MFLMFAIVPAVLALLVLVIPAVSTLVLGLVTPKIPKRLRAPAVLLAGAAVGVGAAAAGMPVDQATQLAGLVGPGALVAHAAAGLIPRKKGKPTHGDQK